MGSQVLDLGLNQTSVDKKWMYKDMISAMTVDSTSRNVNASFDIDAIENSIYNMFLFKKGERIINPEFGNSLYVYLYEPMNKLTAKRIGQGVEDMFERWEPRVKIQNIIVTPLYDENTYVVEVNYTVPTLSDKLLNFTYAVNARR